MFIVHRTIACDVWHYLISRESTMSTRTVPKRTMGFVTATAMLIGTVIGASVFIVPGALAASAGPAVWLTYLIGAILILFAAVMFAQIGSVMPEIGRAHV